MRSVVVENDVVYARAGGQTLALDIYRVERTASPSVVLYLHGGGWAVGDKADGSAERLEALTRVGVRVASANYRLTSATAYPAQIHDVKAAVRWLRANGAQRSLAVHRLAAWRASARAYLATMTGLTTGDPYLEGTVGDHKDESSAVRAVVSWFGPSNLAQTSRRTWLEARSGRALRIRSIPSRENYTGSFRSKSGKPDQSSWSRRPGVFHSHGSLDRIVAESEERALHDALVRHGCDVTMIILGGAGHEDPKFDSEFI
jgi:acetyl esterase/lipase